LPNQLLGSPFCVRPFSAALVVRPMSGFARGARVLAALCPAAMCTTYRSRGLFDFADNIPRGAYALFPSLIIPLFLLLDLRANSASRTLRKAGFSRQDQSMGRSVGSLLNAPLAINRLFYEAIGSIEFDRNSLSPYLRAIACDFFLFAHGPFLWPLRPPEMLTSDFPASVFPFSVRIFFSEPQFAAGP